MAFPLRPRRFTLPADLYSMPPDQQPGVYLPRARRGEPRRSRERRRHVREPFPVYQRMADLPGHEQLTEADFHRVRCHDASLGGISFWTRRRPLHNELWLELGLDDSTRIVGAAVRHVEAITCLESPLVLVGCELAKSRRD